MNSQRQCSYEEDYGVEKEKSTETSFPKKKNQ